ncbi:MAG: DUF4855 domain-containing protein, partial [Bacteroidales bacterium]|nr:DUF4855 domain-containing protein [Bacteroidales bacterium]
MWIDRGLIVAGVFLLLAGCREKEATVTPSKPALQADIKEVRAYSAGFTVKTIETARVRYGLSRDMDLSVETGTTGPSSLEISVENLEPLTDYTLFLQAVGADGNAGATVEVPFCTLEGTDTIYPWEKARRKVPSFADISLITLGWHNYNPPSWTARRFASHVSFEGKWLFDAFLCIDGWDPVRNLSYSVTPSRSSATRESWEDLADAWLGEDGALKGLDKAVSEAALGAPPKPRHIVMSVPDPIRYSFFGNSASSTTYWGAIDGVAMDFSKTEDQIRAYRWYMDLCRKLFHERGFSHLELAGFYVLSEELPLDPEFYRSCGQSYQSGIDDWNWEKKNWEIIVPEVAAYAHACNEGLWWVPYHMAPGYKVWKNLGFDMAWMQPNYYWDHDQISHPLTVTEGAIKTYGMGIELEFEYSLVSSVMADGRSGPDGS